jgi:hypothetical protein
MLPEGFGEVAEKLRRSTVQVLNIGRASGGSGSGIIWDSNGTVITNAHVASEERFEWSCGTADRSPRRLRRVTATQI